MADDKQSDPGNQASDQELDDFAQLLGADDAQDVRDQHDK
jgi:hypothetical protein